jgi:hypothetical protein
MHGGGAKVDPARPFNTTKFGVHTHRIEYSGVEKSKKNAPPTPGLHAINALDSIVEPDLQPKTIKRLCFNNVNHR